MPLYSIRLKQPKIAGKDATWADVNTKVKASLEDAKAKGGNVVVLTNTMASPSTDALIASLVAKCRFESLFVCSVDWLSGYCQRGKSRFELLYLYFLY